MKTVAALAALAALASGCLECAATDAGPVTFFACGESAAVVTEYADNWEPAELFFCAFDDVLESRDMPALTPHLEGYEIEIFVDPERTQAGLTFQEQKRVEIYLSEIGQDWHFSALAHETAHVYESEVLHLDSSDWIEVSQDEYDPRHFALGRFAVDLFVEAKELATSPGRESCF